MNLLNILSATITLFMVIDIIGSLPLIFNIQNTAKIRLYSLLVYICF